MKFNHKKPLGSLAVISSVGLLFTGQFSSAALIAVGHNTVYEDTIDPGVYGSDDTSIDGVNGWSVTGEAINFRTFDNGRFSATNLGTIGTASRAATVVSGDTLLRIATFIRFREQGTREQRVAVTSGGTELLSFGTGLGTASLVTGAGLTFTPDATNTISTGGHQFLYMEVIYNELTGSGEILGHLRANGNDVSDAPLVSYGTFTGTFDVDSIDGITYASEDTSGFVQQLGIGTSVPEPSTGLLAGVGLMLLGRRRRA